MGGSPDYPCQARRSARPGVQALAIVRESDVVHKLFEEAPQRFGSISGGYTRVVKLDRRPGDASLMSLIELVRSEEKPKKKKKAKKKTEAKPAPVAAPEPVTEESAEAAEAAEPAAEEAVEATDAEAPAEAEAEAAEADRGRPKRRRRPTPQKKREKRRKPRRINNFASIPLHFKALSNRFDRGLSVLGKQPPQKPGVLEYWSVGGLHHATISLK